MSDNKGGTPMVPKLLCTLNNKSKYIIHYRNLKLYLSLGLKLIKIHRMILFDQASWLKKYIELNTSLRTKAKNNFEKDLFNLMNNSVFGKQTENLKKRTNVFLCTNEIDYQNKQRRMAGLLLSCRTIFDEDLALVRMSNKKVKLCKPIYGGFTIQTLDV